MATLGELVIRMRVDDSDVERRFAKNTRSLNAFADAASNVGNRLALGVTAPLAGLAVASVRAAADIESLTRGLEAIVGSADEAGRQLVRLTELARLPGINFEQAIRGSTSLQAVGFSAQFAERTLRGVANAVALSGGGAGEFEGVIRQLRQVAGLGRLMGEELNVILENAPAMAKALQAAFGTSNAERIRQMGLTTEEFFERLNQGLASLPQVEGGLKNALENLGQSVKRALGTLVGGDVENLTRFFDGLGEKIEAVAQAFADLSPNTRRAVQGFGAFLFVLGPATLALSTFANAVRTIAAISLVSNVAGGTRAFLSLIPAIRGAADVTALFGFAMRGTIGFLTGPAGIATLVVGAAAAFGLMKIRAAESARESARAWQDAVTNIRASLAGIDRARLESDYLRQISQRSGVQEQIAAIKTYQSALRKQREEMVKTGGAFGNVKERRENAEAFRQNETALANLKTLDAKLGQQMRATSDELAARNASLIETGNAFADAGGGAKDLSAQLERVRDAALELSLLKGFGLTSMAQANEPIRDVIERFQELTGRIRSLGSDLAELGASAPAGGYEALNVLRGQLTDLGREMEAVREIFSHQIVPNVAVPTQPLSIPFVLTQASHPGDVATPGILGLSRFEESLFDLLPSLDQFQRYVDDSGGRLALLGDMAADRLGSALMGVYDMFSRLTPLGLVAEFISSAMEALAPAINALLVPVQIVGQALGSALVPVLKLLFPVFKGLGIAVAFVGEIIFRVADGISSAIGYLLIGIGRFLDGIWGLDDFGLIKAGEKMVKFFDGSVDAFVEARKKISDLTWDEAIGGVNALGEATSRVAESLTNIPQIFDLVGRRMMAATAVAGGLVVGGVSVSGPSDTNPSIPRDRPALVVNVNSPAAGVDAKSLEKQLVTVLDRNPEVRAILARMG